MVITPRSRAGASSHDAQSLLDAALHAGEGRLTTSGALAVETGTFTGRSPRDKYVVDEPGSRDAIWWGPVNQPLTEAAFELLISEVESHLAATTSWNQTLAVGADPDWQVPIHLTTERAWVALFSRHLFIVPERSDPDAFPITILHAPTYHADPARFGTRSSTVIAMHPTRRIIVIAGTAYAGEVKKAVFTLMQYLLPRHNIATMHCSANLDAAGNTTLFFGLSGTGKTTLSNDPRFRLVGDDEHGWSDQGVFNFEGGCYAKTLNLSAEGEPGIYAATNRPGTILENVVVDPLGVPDFESNALTDNARSAFSLEAIAGAVPSGMGPHPSRIVFLTADASGVLPPVARLTPEEAIGLFLLGFTSKAPGTERGLTTPEMTFSAAFGAPFLPRPPRRYADLLAAKIAKHAPSLWLVNTGWTGGSFTTGTRISLKHTRTIVVAIANDRLDQAVFAPEPVFGLQVPTAIDGIPSDTLQPRQSWHDTAAYDEAAADLRTAFRQQAATLDSDPAWLAWLG